MELIALTPTLSQREREPIWSRFTVPLPEGEGQGEGGIRAMIPIILGALISMRHKKHNIDERCHCEE